MRLNGWNRWLLIVGLLLGWCQKGQSQPSQKQLHELDSLYTWHVFGHHPEPDSTEQELRSANVFRSLRALLQKAKKIESLSLRVDQQKDLKLLRQLREVRVLHLSGLTAQNADSLFLFIQDWPLLERLVIDLDGTDTSKPDTTRLVALPTTLRRLAKLNEVRIVGYDLHLNWNESLRALAGVKTLERLVVDLLQTSSQVKPDFAVLTQVKALIIAGSEWTVEPESFASMRQLKELELVGLQLDSLTLQPVLNELISLERFGMGSCRLGQKLALGKLKNLKFVELGTNEGLVINAATFAGLTNLERIEIQGAESLNLSGLCNLPKLQVLKIEGTYRSTARLPDCIGQWSQLTELSVDKSLLGQLPANIGSLRRLKKLNLTYCGLNELPNAFNQLTALHEVNLNNNKLRQLPGLRNLRALQQMDVSFNQLTTLPEDIGRLKQLKTLKVRRNKLTQLPTSLTQLASLTELDVSNNQLTNLPELMEQLSTLKRLSINSNQIKQLPDGIGKLRNLQSLAIGQNELTTLPNSIGQLDSLGFLWIGKNHLRELPTCVTKLKNLWRLSLGGNEIMSLPDSIGALRKLRTLTLDSLPITQLPTSIGQLVNLTDVSITATKLQELPASIGALTKLYMIELYDNELTTLPTSIGRWKSMTHIYLVGNRLESLPESIGGLTNLKGLTINGRPDQTNGGLRQLPDSIVHCLNLEELLLENQPQLDASDVFTKAARMKRLKTLATVNCNMSRWPDIRWSEVQWQGVNVSKNQLTTLPAGLLDAPKLRYVSTEENRLPGILNRQFHDKYGLQTALVEVGALPIEKISKPNEQIAHYYHYMAVQKELHGDWTGAMADAQKAIDYMPDTAISYLYEHRAGLLFALREYTKAIADYEKAIAYVQHTLPDRQQANQKLSYILWRKALALGAMGQHETALLELEQAERTLPNPKANSWLSYIYTDRGKFLLLTDKAEAADSSFRKAIKVYETSQPQPSTDLLIAQLDLVIGQYNRAQQVLADSSAKPLLEGFEIVKEHLKTCLALLIGLKDGQKAVEHFNTFLKKTPTTFFGWDFDLFDTWLSKAKLPTEQTAALRQLTEAAKRQSRKSYY